MAIVGFKTPLLKGDAQIGLLSFSINDEVSFDFKFESGVKLTTMNLEPQTGQLKYDTSDLGRNLTGFPIRDNDLLLQINPNGITEVQQFKEGVKLTSKNKSPFSEKKLPTFAYMPGGIVSFLEGDIKQVNRWGSFQYAELAVVIAYQFWCIINPSAGNSLLVSGTLGKTQKIALDEPAPDKPVPVEPVPPKRLQFPNQSPPVNRRTIFDSNQNNADPAVALGSDPNDPMRFSEPVACGCYVLADISSTRCLSACHR